MTQDQPQTPHYTRKSEESQVNFPEEARSPVDQARKVDVHYDLLTLREAMQRFRVYRQRIYLWVQEGRLHPVKPNGRTLYPSWELEELVRELGQKRIALLGPYEGLAGAA